MWAALWKVGEDERKAGVLRENLSTLAEEITLTRRLSSQEALGCVGRTSVLNKSCVCTSYMDTSNYYILSVDMKHLFPFL